MHYCAKLFLQKGFVTLIGSSIISKKLAWSNSIINLFIGHILWNPFRLSVRSCEMCALWKYTFVQFKEKVINSSRDYLPYLGSYVISLWGEKVLHNIQLFIGINIHGVIYLAMH